MTTLLHGDRLAHLAELTADLDEQRAAGSILITEVGRSNSHTALFLSAAREAGLLAGIRERVRAADPGATPFAVWNPLLPAAVELADAHLRNLTLRSFDEHVRSAAEPEIAEALRAVQVLYGLSIVHEDLAWHLEHGSLTPADVARLRAARDRALARVHDHAAAVVHAFAMPAERLRAPIAA